VEFFPRVRLTINHTGFDRLLIEVPGRETVYAVRHTAIINGATVEDAEKSGLGEVRKSYPRGAMLRGLFSAGARPNSWKSSRRRT